MHQQPGVARQRGGVAADVDDATRQTGPAGRVQVGHGLGQREGALSRRIHQPAIGGAVAGQVGRADLKQVLRLEARVRAQAVGAGVVAGTLHQGRAALDAQHLARQRGQRQREVAQAAEPVDHAVARLHAQQPHRPLHQHAVDLRVDLREVGGLERHGHAELGQAVGQRRAALVEPVHGVGPARLQPPLHAVGAAEGAQPIGVGRGQRLQVAQHQRDDLVARGQLDLRQPVALVHAADQLAQWHQHRADRRVQHRAHLHVGHVAALAFVEADQHHALLGHVPHRQPGAEAVAPGRAVQRAQQPFGPHLGQVLQVVLEHPGLHGHLGGRVQVLHLAAAAGAGVQAEVRAGGLHALRALARQRRHRALLPGVLAARHLHLHALAGQRALDEHHLAVGAARHALGLEVERLDLQPIVSVGHGR